MLEDLDEGLKDHLSELARRHILLLANGTLWRSPSAIPMEVRRAHSRYKPAIRKLIAACDYRVCASPGLHYLQWTHEGQCTLCAQLTPAITALDDQAQTRRKLASHKVALFV